MKYLKIPPIFLYFLNLKKVFQAISSLKRFSLAILGTRAMLSKILTVNLPNGVFFEVNLSNFQDWMQISKNKK